MGGCIHFVLSEFVYTREISFIRWFLPASILGLYSCGAIDIDLKFYLFTIWYAEFQFQALGIHF